MDAIEGDDSMARLDYARDCKTSEYRDSKGKFSAVQSYESKVMLMDVVKVTMVNNGPE